MSRCNYGKSQQSPKARANAKREAEKDERKYEKTCDHDSIHSLMKSKKGKK